MKIKFNRLMLSIIGVLLLISLIPNFSKSYYKNNELNPLLSGSYSNGPIEIEYSHKSVAIPYDEQWMLSWNFSLNDGGDINNIHWYFGEYYFNDYCCGYQYSGIDSGTGGIVIYWTMGPFCTTYPWYFTCQGKYYSNSVDKTYVIAWCIKVTTTTGYPCDPCNPAGSCDNLHPAPGGSQLTEDGNTVNETTPPIIIDDDGCKVPAFEPVSFFLINILCIGAISLITIKKMIKKESSVKKDE